MSLHDLPAPRKHRRLGLYLPFVAVLVAAIAWTGFWLYARSEARIRMDRAVAELKRAGVEVSWSGRSLGGYPFRLDINLTDARIREPSGWALRAPKLEAEASALALGHWMFATPQGLTFVRPVGGPVAVRGEVLRASLNDLSKQPPSFSFQGRQLTFTPEPGAQPFGLSTAESVEFHLRAGPDDEGGVFTTVKNGQAQLTGLLGRIAAGKPVSITWNATLTKMSAFTGKTWPEAVRNWSQAGGRMVLREGGLTAGEALIGAKTGSLSVGSDGRLSGMLDVTLREAPRALGAMGASGVIAPDAAAAASVVAQARQGTADAAQATVTFQAGQTTLGPVAIGPAPRVYQND